MKILFLLEFGFPYGMASVQRAKLYAQALTENDVEVDVLSLNYSDFPKDFENKITHGNYKGINYDYATGATIRPNSFFGRRLIELRSHAVVTKKMVDQLFERKFDKVFYYGSVIEKNYKLVLYNKLIYSFGIPNVIELCERPWLLEKKSNTFLSNYSPIADTKGCIVISSYLESWVNNEASRLKKRIEICKIPILVDFSEFKIKKLLSEKPTVLFAGSSAYSSSHRFILDSMKYVWRKIPDCKLVITGCHLESRSTNWLVDDLGLHENRNNIEVRGFLNRDELLKEYSHSWSMLAPLFDDIRSQARFPTKIGEYLASGSPVITNNVGEIPKYLHDNVNAYVAYPGNVEEYAEKIIDSILNQEQSKKIAKCGTETAHEYFDYRKYGGTLKDLFSQII